MHSERKSMSGQPEQHVNEGCCKFCGARLSLVKRMSRQEFCSNDHRDEYNRADGGAALGRLQETARPRPSTAPGSSPAKVEAEKPAAGKPTGSILGLSAPVPRPEPPPLRAASPARREPAASNPPPVAVRTAAPPPAAAPPLPPQAAPPAQTMALARTKQRPKQAARPGQFDPALSRLMEAAGGMQEAPAARAPMRFGPERFAMPPAEPEPEFVQPVRAESPSVPVPAPVVSSAPPAAPPPVQVAPTPAAPPVQAAPTPAAPPVPVPPQRPVAPAAPSVSRSLATPVASSTPAESRAPVTPATPVAPAASKAARVEPEEEPMMVERRGARPPASFVLTGQLAYGSRTPRREETEAWEPIVLTPTALPELKVEEEELGSLKIDGESVPGAVGQLRAVAGDLMTILVVRAAPSLLPGLMELPHGPAVEPNDWQAFRDWVRELRRQQDGPDAAEAVEMPAIEPRAIAGTIVQALFGADRFWPNPKTYVVYPTRELVRRTLLQHADLPTHQDTVPLLVNRQYEAAHRRIMADWNPTDGESSIPQAGAVPSEVAPRVSAPDLHNSSSQPAAVQAPSVLPQTGLASSLNAYAASNPSAGASSGDSRPQVASLPGTAQQMGERVHGTGPIYPGRNPGGSQMLPGPSGAISEGLSGGFTGSLSRGIVLPRFGFRMASDESRPLVVLHRQPPTAKMVTLPLEPADRPAGPAPAPPMVAADIQPEIRHAPSGRPAGRLNVSLRLQTMVALSGSEQDSDSPLRGDEEAMIWSWLNSPPAPAVPAARLGVRHARVPVLRTAARLTGADRAGEFFLSPTPVDFTATVDQWSAL
ncbi:MAG: hypothetical protein ABI972_09960 [Acidobacteriota bacterium]